MDILFLIISSILFIFILHGFNLYQKRRLPPGPAGFPIIGNLLDIGSRPHESLAKLSMKHGPLMTVQLGGITTVVASTPDAARDILQHHDLACSSRPMPDVVNAIKKPESAILWIPTNETWRTYRKVLNMYLTNHQELDNRTDLRQNVVDEMLEFLRASARNRAAVDIGELAFAVVVNQLSNTFLSQNVVSYDSGNIGEFKVAVETVMEVLGKFNMADVFPVLKPWDPQSIRRQTKAAYDILDRRIEGLIGERLKHQEAKRPSFGDMLDSLLDFSRDNESKFSLNHIKALIVDLFIAGTDTVTTTVTWTMTELLLNPDMLLRVREEVHQIVGEDGKFKESKILELPYLNAFIKETMRFHLAVPLLAPHKTEIEVNIGNYIVPPNTQIFVNAWAMSRDPRYCENPKEFRPERFLTNNIDYMGQHFEFIPFGSGRRRCPGMPLASRMVSLIVVSFVYHFDWKLPHTKEEMDMNDIFGLALRKATPLVATPIPLKLVDKFQ